MAYLGYPFYGGGCNPCCPPPPCGPICRPQYCNPCPPAPAPAPPCPPADAYGFVYQTGTVTVPTGASVPFNTNGLYLNTTLGSSAITVNLAGNYNAKFLIANPTGTGTPSFGVSVSGGAPSLVFGAVSNGQAVSGSQSLALGQGQSVSVVALNGAVLNTTGSGSYTGISAELSVTLL